MKLWSQSLGRGENQELRKEEDLTGLISEFFSRQHYVESYEVIPTGQCKWVVDVKGSVHLHESDLCGGELFFTLGHLTGDLVCHCPRIKPSVVPSRLDGEIVFVQEEQSTTSTKTEIDTGTDDELMGQFLTDTRPSESSVRKKLAEVISDCINNGYDIDIEGLKRQIMEEHSNRDSYKLVVRFGKKNPVSGVCHCDIFLTDREGEQPLNLTAMQKAFYLTSVYHDEGITLEDPTVGFMEDLKVIYRSLPEKVQSDKGLLTADDFTVITINAYRSKIRNAIKERVTNKDIVDDFSIEGYKGEGFRVRKSTPETRELIQRTFGLMDTN